MFRWSSTRASGSLTNGLGSIGVREYGWRWNSVFSIIFLHYFYSLGRVVPRRIIFAVYWSPRGSLLSSRRAASHASASAREFFTTPLLCKPVSICPLTLTHGLSLLIQLQNPENPKVSMRRYEPRMGSSCCRSTRCLSTNLDRGTHHTSRTWAPAVVVPKGAH